MKRKTHDPSGRPKVLPIASQGEPGFVYFIQAGDDGPIKIGFTTSPQERLDTLQTASPFELRLLTVIDGTLKDEARLHRQFAEFRLKGEWFRDCAPIRALIDERVVSSRRPFTYMGERCGNCQALLVVHEDTLCKACIEFMDEWATPAFKRRWRQSQAA